MQGLMIKDLYSGCIGTAPTTVTRLTKREALDHFAPFKYQEENLRKLITIVQAGDDFYARVNNGSRKGSIVRVDSSQYDVRTPDKNYYGRDRGSTGLGDLIVAKLVEEYQLTGRALVIKYEVTKNISPNVGYGHRVMAQYDGRKDVGLSQDEQYSLEYLPDYQGPTVFVFTKKKRTEEELAADRDPAQHKVFDQIGEEVQIGDLFFYGESNSLTICKLVKISKTGSLTYTAFVNGGTGRIINQIVRESVSKGERVPSLLRFSKDLAGKLMLLKLSN